MQTLNQDIKDRSFKSAYLLFGDEAFLKKSYKNRLKEAITGGDTMNYNYYEGKGINVPEILGMADTMPFFAEKRLILVEDSGFFKGGGEAESLAEYLPNVPDTTCLLFVETEVDKRSKLYKAVKKHGYAAEMVRQSRPSWPVGPRECWPGRERRSPAAPWICFSARPGTTWRTFSRSWTS